VNIVHIVDFLAKKFENYPRLVLEFRKTFLYSENGGNYIPKRIPNVTQNLVARTRQSPGDRRSAGAFTHSGDQVLSHVGYNRPLSKIGSDDFEV